DEMRQGKWRNEIELLQTDLRNGIPLKEGITKRQLPEFYKQMVQVGIESNDLPGVLTLLADHYQKTNLIWMRLKGLMVYPLIVAGCSFCLSLLLVRIFMALGHEFAAAGMFPEGRSSSLELFLNVGIISPAVILGM